MRICKLCWPVYGMQKKRIFLEMPSKRCLGRYSIKYGGQYQSTSGFRMHNCNSNMQTKDYIGFWWSWTGDAAVMMIGGGGSTCGRADHGIGITEG